MYNTLPRKNIKITSYTLKGEQKPKINLSLYESDLIIETYEPTVFCYKAAKKKYKKMKQNFRRYLV